MRIKYYLDTRKLNKQGEGNLYIVVRHKDDTSYISTGIHIAPKDWDAEMQRLTSTACRDKDKAKLNLLLNSRVSEINLALFEARECSFNKVCGIINRMLSSTGADENSFVAHYNEYVSLCNAKRTQELYNSTLSAICRFDRYAERLTFADIDAVWLTRFDKFLQKTSPSVNARAIHFRNIRAVFNSARKAELTTCYPFYNFKIKTQETAKRSLDVEDLRTLFFYEFTDTEVRKQDLYNKRMYLDVFKLLFYLRGMSLIDLCYLKRKNINKNRIEYHRSKTGTFLSVKIEPEAKEIMERYAGEEYLLCIMDKHSDHRNFMKQMHRCLQNLGKERTHLGRGGGKLEGRALFPYLTSYYARHSWATTAYDLDIPLETISDGLGHNYGARMTNIYIKRGQKKVDEANRRIINYINDKL